ncbi:MAG TPA: ABC transporter ATP-binding protein [Acidimicrobiales bacterium]|nr:ABC transporter ATP-binding protein [Acidimicrobiales bacterium]
MRDGTLRAERLWKRFRSDRAAYGLRDQVRRLSERGRGGERWRWALRDVTVDMEPGDSLALVGSNGSGKSTLLKILGGVMYPTAGRLGVAGRVGMIVDVWAGLHHELTGRENLFLAGSLLGLRRAEVAARFDEIVDFAELDHALDRPAKFYSTGMKMRLGFAVASFLEPDVLLVDEVLAVGDARFQQRCLNRMRKVLADGTTLVLVSHDLAAVEATCRRGLWLQEGACVHQGQVAETLARYRQWVEEAAEAAVAFLPGDVRLVKAAVGPGPGDAHARADGPLEVALVVESDEPRTAAICLGVSEGTAAPAFVLRHQARLRPGETEVRCSIAHLPLPGGRFYVWVGAFDGREDVLPWQPAARFDVVGPGLDPAPPGVVRPAPVHVEATWETGARR